MRHALVIGNTRVTAVRMKPDDESPVELRCAVAVVRGDAVLLLQRPEYGDWVLPGGTPRQHESMGSCARRETREETGLDVHPSRQCPGDSPRAGQNPVFVSTSTIEQATGTTDLDRLGGVVRRLPWAGTGLVIGSLTLAGLPLTAGFASEWFTLESLMQQFRVSSLAMQLATAATGALVALTIGVAGVTFVRMVALTAFGPPRIGEPAIDPDGRASTGSGPTDSASPRSSPAAWGWRRWRRSKCG